MLPDHANLENFEVAPEHTEDNQTPASSTKRNSGRSGPTSSAGRATSSRNATRHGMCAKTLILSYENDADWQQLLTTWLNGYQNPAGDSLLYTFVLKTAQAEWSRLRCQHQYDHFMQNHSNAPITVFEPHEIKALDLVQRYLTTAERRYQREYRMLEQHWKSHHRPTSHKPEQAGQQPDPEPMPEVLFQNNETGESFDCEGNEYPPPPNYVSRPIIPGVYDPDHPAYEGPLLARPPDS